MTTIRIYHNIARDHHDRPLGMMDGYQPAHELTLVAEYTIDHPFVTADLEDAYRLFNVGDDPDFGPTSPIAIAYRNRGNRSLTVGDVIAVQDDHGTTWHAVGSFGWDELTEPRRITGRPAYGTTPLITQPA